MDGYIAYAAQEILHKLHTDTAQWKLANARAAFKCMLESGILQKNDIEKMTLAALNDRFVTFPDYSSLPAIHDEESEVLWIQSRIDSGIRILSW